MSELFEVMVCRLHALRGCTECFNANGPPCRHGLTIACPYCETVTLRARVATLEAALEVEAERICRHCRDYAEAARAGHATGMRRARPGKLRPCEWWHDYDNTAVQGQLRCTAEPLRAALARPGVVAAMEG